MGGTEKGRILFSVRHAIKGVAANVETFWADFV